MSFPTRCVWVSSALSFLFFAAESKAVASSIQSSTDFARLVFPQLRSVVYEKNAVSTATGSAELVPGHLLLSGM